MNLGMIVIWLFFFLIFTVGGCVAALIISKVVNYITKNNKKDGGK